MHEQESPEYIDINKIYTYLQMLTKHTVSPLLLPLQYLEEV